MVNPIPQWRKSSTRCGLHVAEAKANVAGRLKENNFKSLRKLKINVKVEMPPGSHGRSRGFTNPGRALEQCNGEHHQTLAYSPQQYV